MRERFLGIEAAVERKIHQPHVPIDEQPPHGRFESPAAHVCHHALSLALRELAGNRNGDTPQLAAIVFALIWFEKMRLDEVERGLRLGGAECFGVERAIRVEWLGHVAQDDGEDDAVLIGLAARNFQNDRGWWR